MKFMGHANHGETSQGEELASYETNSRLIETLKKHKNEVVIVAGMIFLSACTNVEATANTSGTTNPEDIRTGLPSTPLETSLPQNIATPESVLATTTEPDTQNLAEGEDLNPTSTPTSIPVPTPTPTNSITTQTQNANETG